MGVRILLIDDNLTDCARIVDELRQEFLEADIRQISDAQSYAGVIEGGDFDVVLCDYHLPWTDGLTILRSVKARWPDVPVLMVTGSGNERIAIESIKAGLDDYIIKSPGHLERLPSAVRSALERLEQRHRLGEIEMRYRTLFDRVPVGLYRATPDGEFLDVNPALVEILGYPDRESLMAVHASTLYCTPADQARWQSLAERDGIVRQFEIAFRRRDGSIVWTRNSARAIRDLHGRTLCYEGSLEDVTERRRAEEALAERTRLLEAVRTVTAEITRELDLPALLSLICHRAAELLHAGMGVIYLWDEAGAFLVPRAWRGLDPEIAGLSIRLGEGLTGTVAERRKGMAVHNFQTSPYAHPAFVQGTAAHAAIAEPLLYHDRLVGVITMLLRDPGRTFSPADRETLTLFATQAAVAIQNAALFGEVAQAKTQWENTFDAAADMIALLDIDCRVLRVNPALARHLDMDLVAVRGRSVADLLAGWEGGPTGSGCARCIASGQAMTEECNIPGTGEIFLHTYSPWRDAEDRVVGVVWISKDVTTQRQLQQQLTHSEKMVAMGRLISGVAHELNNPLTAIFGNAQLLKLGAADEATRQRAEVLVSEAERAAKIVRNLLAFARPYKPERRPLHLPPLVEETLSLRSYELRVHNVQLQVDLPPELPPILADPHQIQQVLVNLLINAEHAVTGRSGACIQVSAQVASDERVRLRVADNGAGIPLDVLGRIFEPFFTTKEDGKGTGLGLAICYAIVQEHGGRIRAGNRPEGGAWFEFELPAHTDAPAAASSETAQVAGPPPTRQKQILVADDEAAIGRVVAGALTMMGHQVDVVQDGALAVERLQEVNYDLVFMDMKMPGFDGETIYDEVIARKAIRPEVIIMTGDTISKNTRSFLERTGLRCIEKPFNLEAIWDCVRELERSADPDGETEGLPGHP
jgi:two-component system, NtrC family, sensor kinase